MALSRRCSGRTEPVAAQGSDAMSLWDDIQRKAKEEIEKVQKGSKDIDLTAKTRFLTRREVKLAQIVFEDTLPWEKIKIAADVGYNSRPWTHPDPLDWSKYLIHMGPVGFADSTSDKVHATGTGQVRDVFIHELVHVWQGVCGLWPWDYVIGSCCDQAAKGDLAYSIINVDGTQPWNSLGVEQQATVIEHWFIANGRSDPHAQKNFAKEKAKWAAKKEAAAKSHGKFTHLDPNRFFRYVRDNIRKKRTVG